MAARCSTCGASLVQFCPACRGRRGGRAKSNRKAITARLNAAQPRPRKRGSARAT